MLIEKKLGVIGAGNMAEALIKGVLKSKIISGYHIIACDLAEERRAVFKDMGCVVTENIAEVLEADILLVALKPQVVFSVLEGVGKKLTSEQLLISIVAGVTLESLQNVAPKVRIIRVMPNTPMFVSKGVSGVARGRDATDHDLSLTLELFGAAGDAYEVDESHIDAVTGLSGSGPAYLFYFTEAMAEAGRLAGLPAELAESMACNTIIGAAKLLEEGNDSAAILRRKVTSPNGTTEAALKVMEKKGLKDIVISAVLRAKERSEELARGE